MKARNDPISHSPIILRKFRRNTPPLNRARQPRTFSVRARPGNQTQGLLAVGGLVFACALGRTGISAFKHESDGATPQAVMRPLAVFFRSDRWRAGIGPVRLPVAVIRPDLGWCDASGDPNYNRPVPLPYAASHERMLRSDRLYDMCIVLDWNILPRRRNRGSAIFLHLAHPGMEPTEGCIAVAPGVMARLLPLLSLKTRIIVSR